MNYKYLLVSLALLSGCTYYDLEEGKNGMPKHAVDLEEFNEWKHEKDYKEINEIEHLLFAMNYEDNKLEILKINGGMNCLPAQIKIAERYAKRFYAEYYNQLMTDAQTTLVKLQAQNNKIYQMLSEVRYETTCKTDTNLYLTVINKKIQEIEGDGLLFDEDSSKIKKETMYKIMNISYLLKDFDIDKFIVVGNTNTNGTEIYNFGLGERRAQAVKNVFVNNGYDPSKIVIRSYGEIKQISTNLNLNRRVHIFVDQNSVEERKAKEVNYRLKDWDIKEF